MKVCVVTGGAGSIGEAISRRLVKDGWSLVITYNKNKARAESLAGELPRTRSEQLDVTNQKHVRTLFDQISRGEGDFLGLVNNAGMNITADFDRQKLEDFQAVINTNLVGPFITTQAAAEYMDGGGSVVHIGSLSADTGGPRSPAYAAAKKGLEALSVCAARFLGDPTFKSIRSNVVSPGVIANEMTSNTMADWVKEFNESRLLLGRFGFPKDVSGLVSFLLSEDAEWITGQVFRVNGGAY